MSKSRLLWKTIGIIASMSTILFIGGFVYATNQILFPKAASGNLLAPAPTAKSGNAMEVKDKIQIVALGDSLTAGTGDNTGKGYVGRVREKLELQTGKPTFILNNLAIPGYRTSQLLEDLKQKKTQDALAEADIILLTIGGNDIFDGGTGIFTEGQEGFNPKAAQERSGPALERVDQIITAISKVNSAATIFYVGLYHPFLDLDPNREGSLIVQKWNTSVFAMTNRYPNMVLVPTYDLFERNLMKYLATDHFHPNQDGYERIADRIAQILK
jgi:lysophospholipase L1-like esterase